MVEVPELRRYTARSTKIVGGSVMFLFGFVLVVFVLLLVPVILGGHSLLLLQCSSCSS